MYIMTLYMMSVVLLYPQKRKERAAAVTKNPRLTEEQKKKMAQCYNK